LKGSVRSMKFDDRLKKISISLGKPSLRRRLEDYYTLVAPDQLENDWLKRFQKIWEKFGGTHEGEAKLGAKLAKKYGRSVYFLAVTDSDNDANDQARLQLQTKTSLVPEESFQLHSNQLESGVLDCLSDDFDPCKILRAPLTEVNQVSPWMSTSNSILDRVDQFRPYLPTTDPLYQPKPAARKRERPAEKTTPKAMSVLSSMAAPFEVGPLSVLYKCMTERKRARVVMRYVNCIRGTMTGHVVGFDKHMNLLLRDVDEVYTPLWVDQECDDPKSNAEIELERRIHGASGSDGDELWTLRQRHLKQIMVRGDNIVSVYRAEQEQSAWPSTSKSPGESIYRIRTARSDVPPARRIGTQGSLLYASQRNQSKRQRDDYSSASRDGRHNTV
jgi:small nuclear ribonucleoprotein (snRNP)-like protein